MRILHLSAFYPPHTVGGAERSVAMLAEAQVRAGHDVAVACTTPGNFVEEVRNGVRVFRIPHETLFWSEDVASQSPLAFHWRKFTMPFNRRQRGHFEQVLSMVEPDIFNSHSMVDVTTGVWLAAKAYGVPVVHTLRDYDLICAEGGLYHDGKPCGSRCRVITFAKQRQHNAIDTVIANSAETLRLHTERSLFTHIPTERQYVIWNISGLPDIEPDFIRGPREGTFTIGYFGRITEEKGVGTLIEAVRALAPQADIRLRIGGRLSQETDSFRKQAAGLPVDWLDFIDGPSFFPTIDIMAIPSIWPEPLPRTALESYAAGVPVLGSRAGGTPDLIGHDNADWLFKPGDVADLTAKLARIVAAGRGALPSITSFQSVLKQTTESVVFDRYMTAYQDTLASRSKRLT
jgi:glycosyltransferase involved in cell wall biosynthesis